METLREVEPLVADRFPGNLEHGCIAAVEKLLHKAPYEHAELEALLGVSLPDFFHGNASQLRVLEAAAGAGAPVLLNLHWNDKPFLHRGKWGLQSPSGMNCTCGAIYSNLNMTLSGECVIL